MELLDWGVLAPHWRLPWRKPVSYTHLLRQTRQKTVRSFQTVLNLMDRYPEYKFMSSQPQLYQFVKEEAPWIFEKIKEKVKDCLLYTSLSLYWWGNQTRNDLTKKAVDLYMEQNPNIEITVEFTDWSGYWDKLSAMAAGGNMPDIIQQDYSYINQYQPAGRSADTG